MAFPSCFRFAPFFHLLLLSQIYVDAKNVSTFDAEAKEFSCCASNKVDLWNPTCHDSDLIKCANGESCQFNVQLNYDSSYLHKFISCRPKTHSQLQCYEDHYDNTICSCGRDDNFNKCNPIAFLQQLRIQFCPVPPHQKSTPKCIEDTTDPYCHYEVTRTPNGKFQFELTRTFCRLAKYELSSFQGKQWPVICGVKDTKQNIFECKCVGVDCVEQKLTNVVESKTADLSKPVFADQQCGKSSVEPTIELSTTSDLLQGRYPAVPHSWPWIVSIQYRDFGIGRAWKHVCTGALISSRVVMTNGACFFESKNSGRTLAETRSRSPYNWLVVLGSHNNSVLANVDTSFTVESFKGFPERYNSAIYYPLLITLTDDFPKSPFINKICVRQERFPAGYPQCFVAGWNYGSEIGTRDEQFLHEAQVKIVSKEKYNAETGNSLSEHEIATVRNGSFIPKQFNGDPLMCRNWWNDNIGSWFLEGYQSWTTRGNDGKIYTVFNKYLPN